MYQIQIGDNYYNVGGTEAAWAAFRKACEFMEMVTHIETVYLVDCELADEGKPAVVASSDDLD